MSVDVRQSLTSAEQLAAGSLQAYGQRDGLQSRAATERLATNLLQRARKHTTAETAEVLERSAEQSLRSGGVLEVNLLQRLQ